MIEWTKTQQILCFCQSLLLGATLGVLFEIETAFTRLAKGKNTVFLLDAIYGLIAAVITFFVALVITDGQMHPLLFIGSLLGFFCEHSSVGKYISSGVTRFVRLVGKMYRFLLDLLEGLLLTGCDKLVCVGKCWYHWAKQRYNTRK